MGDVLEQENEFRDTVDDLLVAWDDLASAIGIALESREGPDVAEAFADMGLAQLRAHGELERIMRELQGDDAPEVVPSREVAIETVRREHDRLLEALMGQIDVTGDVQEGKYQMKMGNLRKAAGKMMRKSMRARDAALAVLTEREA
jgi:hypothetical protein